MSEQNTDPRVEIICQVRDIPIDIDKFTKLAEYVCSYFKVNNAFVSITIVDDKRIVEINELYLNRSSVTDVISFDLSDDIDKTRVFELVINVDEARRQAAARDHALDAELALYITHGLLHNLGFDDCDEARSIKMHNMEDLILQQAGFGIVYGK